MTPSAAVFVMMSNYFHDVATAMPVACSVTLWLIVRRYEESESGSASPVAGLRRFHSGLRTLMVFSWVWILSAGLLRLATFGSYEWPHALERNHGGGLLLKYAVAVAIMGLGTYVWIVVSRRAQQRGKAG